jgi:hypothetical protein
VVPPEVARAKEAPLICTCNVAALAEQAAQLAVTVATRVDWLLGSAVKVTVASPVVASVVTDELLKMEDPFAARLITAPLTSALEESSARAVIVSELVPSAPIDSGLGAVSNMLAIEEVVPVVAGVDEGVLALPPPPPHATSVAMISAPNRDLIMDILETLFMLFIFSSTRYGRPKHAE